MESLENYITRLRNIERLTRNGNTDQSVKESGLLLSEINFKWENSVKEGHVDPEVTELMVNAGVVHVRALIASDNPTEAASTSISILALISAANLHSDSLDIAELELLNNALNAISAHMVRYETTTDEYVVTHYTTILRYLLSIHYAIYRKVSSSNPECPLLPSSYLTLKQFISENVPIDTPMVNVNGEEADPLKPKEIYADILGRMKALGWRL